MENELQGYEKEKKPKSRGGRWRKFLSQWQLQLMVLPGIAFLIVFNYVPLYGLVIAFKNYTVIDTISTAPWVGLNNFKIVLSDYYFWVAVGNTLAISLLKLACGFIIPIGLAIMIFEVKNSYFKRFVQTISYLPHFLSWIILGGLLINWLSTTGLLNQILISLGVMDQGVNHLLSADKYWWVAVFSDIWKESGWGTILYLATMAKIDPAYYEAARMDGASKWKQIFHITIPMLRPIIALNLILNVSGLLGSNLDQTLVLMNSQNQGRSEVINSYVYRMGLVQGDFSYATAVGLGVSVVSIILLVIANRVTKKMNDNRSVIF